jgi:SAM-dependent methyltransferase
VTSGEILSQAFEHIPALLFIWLTIYAAYWLVGIVKWPEAAGYDNLRDWGSVDVKALGGFTYGSLALISLASLFMELLLIRWITSEIRVFAYFKSLVLIACFLGFGLGCYLTRQKIRVSQTLIPWLALMLLIQTPWDPVRRLVVNLSGFIGWFSDVHIWTRAYFSGNYLWGVISATLAMSVVIPLFGLIAVTFIPMGQLVGRYLENSTKGIAAYSVNVLASIGGIWLYTALSFLSTPPVVWFACLALGLIAYFWRLPDARRAVLVWSVVVLLLFAAGSLRTEWWGEESWKGSQPEAYQLEPGPAQTVWSPYQKLTLIPLNKGTETVRYILNTNDSWYQQILDLSDVGRARAPELLDDTPIQYHQYNLPYQFYRDPPRVLIAGAGMGNDVAAALRNGAGHVTAVEIDPMIYAKGRQLHFEAPYLSDRVELHIDDARSFIQNTKATYDLIVFSILDSHTTSSYYTNIRLDNYVYTLEALEATKRRLNPDGVLVLSFSSERQWFATRMHDIIVQAFGKEPVMMQPNITFFVIGPGDRAEAALASDPNLKRFVDSYSRIDFEPAELTTDDWPYLYQQYRGVPAITWMLSIGLVVMCWMSFTKLRPLSEGLRWHFFFLGAAFMMLEVQIISKAALLFGTTWLVNSIVITTLLIFILLSNLVAVWFPRLSPTFAYVGLAATLSASYLVPPNALFVESMLLRGMVGTALYCSPAFFAGLIFISSFRRHGYRAEAFGSNLLGALVGGLLESLSLLVGIQALVIVAGALYLLSLMTMGEVRAKAPVVG